MKRAVIALAVAALPVVAVSAGLPPPNDHTDLEFAIHLRRHKHTFQYTNGVAAETTVERISATWYERVAQRIELGLDGGKIYLYQTGNPSTAGLEPDGYHAGVALRAILLDTQLLTLLLQTSYIYQRVDHNGATQSAVLSWYQPSVELGVSLSPVKRLRAFGGARWSDIDGRERISGATPVTTEFEGDDHISAFLGLDFAVDRNGFVGFEARSGADRGGEIYFKRRY